MIIIICYFMLFTLNLIRIRSKFTFILIINIVYIIILIIKIVSIIILIIFIKIIL